jgi:hypothetical protein
MQIDSSRALKFAGIAFGLWVVYWLWTGPDRARAHMVAENRDSPEQAMAPAQTDVPPPLPVSRLAADELLSAYRSNEIKADMLYKGKRFRLTGTVMRIRSDFMNEPQIELVREYSGVTVKGIGKQLAASLNKGDTFEADCTVNGSIVGSPIADCS